MGEKEARATTCTVEVARIRWEKEMHPSCSQMTLGRKPLVYAALSRLTDHVDCIGVCSKNSKENHLG